MEKLDMKTRDITKKNVKKLKELFPHIVTETINKQGELVRSIDFNTLKQELKGEIVGETQERYQMTWPGKKEALFTANIPINKTLRPVKEDSVDWDTTQNLYIEGDNLEALKILQESYLEKVKMIYIDPPYNTGKDFVYKDNFRKSQEDHQLSMGDLSEEGEKLSDRYDINSESNGRYHSDWLTMMYPRLKLARNLLSDDGVIFISIDDCEQSNLKKVCDEIYGEDNFIAHLIWEKSFAPKNDAKFVSNSHDFILTYAKNINCFEIGKLKRTKEANSRYKNFDNDPRGVWISDNLTVKTYSEKYDYPITVPSGKVVNPSHGSCWRVNRDKFNDLVKDNRIWFGKDGNNVPRLKRFLSEVSKGMVPISILYHKEVGHNQEGRQELKKIFDDKGYFDGPKPVRLLRRLISIANLNNNSIILDFFSGSSSTAHAVMKLNSEEDGNRKYIMIQLPESTDEKSESNKAGYENICEIGKERIRRAGNKIIEELKEKEKQVSLADADAEKRSETFDIGFRVYKIDSSNMKDVYYNPLEIKQQDMSSMISNVKEDRDDDDLLAQVILDTGLELSLPMEERVICDKKVHFVGYNSLIACFEKNLSEEVIEKIAEEKPLKAVFRDSSFSRDDGKINLEEKFKMISPDTDISVL